MASGSAVPHVSLGPTPLLSCCPCQHGPHAFCELLPCQLSPHALNSYSLDCCPLAISGKMACLQELCEHALTSHLLDSPNSA